MIDFILFSFCFQLGLVQKIAKRKSDLRLYADELGKGFVGELDYRLEAENAIEFRVLAQLVVWFLDDGLVHLHQLYQCIEIPCYPYI